jgi:NurA-like 5'-3' nuclease
MVPGPAYLDVDAIVKSLIRNAVGTNLMVKFDSNSPVLRADVLASNIDEALGKLVGNDIVAGGYPETLRLAHYVSTFTSTEMTCLRSYVLNNYEDSVQER